MADNKKQGSKQNLSDDQGMPGMDGHADPGRERNQSAENMPKAEFVCNLCGREASKASSLCEATEA